MLESEITRRILKHIRSRGGYALKIHGSAMQPKTIDVVACYRGYFFGIEVKQPGKDATERQRFTLEQVLEAGGRSLVAVSVEDVSNILDTVDAVRIAAPNTVGMPILDKRRDKAIALLGKMVAQFDSEFIYAVASELGMEACLEMPEEGTGPIEFDLTPLQAVAIASALAACNELRESALRR